MRILLDDVKYGCRMLAKTPGFTVVAILTLALGIGANTAVFSVLNAVVLRPLPYPESDRLVSVQSLRIHNRDFGRDSRKGASIENLSYPDFFDFRSQNHVFEHLITYRDTPFTLTGFGQPRQLSGELVTWDLFPLLRIHPALGRGFVPAEETAGTHVAVLSHELWQDQFGSDRGIVGRTISLNSLSYTVVGVAPAGFVFPVDNPGVQLWTTISTEAEPSPGTTPITAQRGARLLPGLGRLKPGISIDRARAELDVIAQALAKKYPDSNTNTAATSVEPELDRLIGDTRQPLLILLGAVGLVLLIACANVANLLLARTTTREHEIAVRAALGASRIRVVRQLLTESLLLAFFGGAAGTIAATYALELLLPLGGSSIPRLAQAPIDGRVLGFSLLLAFLTTAFFGIAPALRASNVDLTHSLKEGSRTSVEGPSRLRSALSVGQVALGLVLVTGAGLLMASFLHLERSDLGMRSDRVLTFWFSLPGTQYREAQGIQFYDRLLERLNAVPGVRSAAGVWPLPLGSDRAIISFDIQERPAPGPKRPHADIAFATPGYFRTAGIPLLKGRIFTELDNAKAPAVLVVNKAFADKFFPGEDVIGKRIRSGAIARAAGTKTQEIVGVVGNVKLNALEPEPPPIYYFPFKQLPWQPPVVVLHTAVPPSTVEFAIREQMAALDPQVPIFDVRTMDDLLSLSIMQPRFDTLLLATFAGMALLLTIVGLYGVTAYSVGRRTREMGLRIALGASRSAVLSMVLKQALGLVSFGIGVGLAGALATTRLLHSMLYGVAPLNPLVFATACSLIALTGVIAAYLPARRAAQVDPMIALRYE